MDTTPYLIGFMVNDMHSEAEVRPCCGENNVVTYGIYVNGQLAFNITKSADEGKWVITLRNADRNYPDLVVQKIGSRIDAHNNGKDVI